MADTEQLCGKRYQRHADRRAYRWGLIGSAIGWHGGKAAVRRPPVRRRGGGEVQLSFTASGKMCRTSSCRRRRLLLPACQLPQLGGQDVEGRFHVGGKGLAENFPMLRFGSDRGAAPPPPISLSAKFTPFSFGPGLERGHHCAEPPTGQTCAFIPFQGLPD